MEGVVEIKLETKTRGQIFHEGPWTGHGLFYNKTLSHFESPAMLSRNGEFPATPLETDSVGGLGGGLSSCTVDSDHRRLFHRELSAIPGKHRSVSWRWEE